jgi:hypothetical protein
MREPEAEETLRLCYRSLGYGYAYLSEIDNANLWLKKYLACCGSDCSQVQQWLKVRGK